MALPYNSTVCVQFVRQPPLNRPKALARNLLRGKFQNAAFRSLAPRMSRKVSLYHKTEYKYERAIRLGPQVIRLRPAAHSRTAIQSYSLRISPTDHYLNWQQDVAGNFQARVVVPEPTDHFLIEVNLVANMVALNPFDFFIEQGFESVPFTYPDEIRDELAPYLKLLPGSGSDFNDWVADLRRDLLSADDLHSVAFLSNLNKATRDRVDYLIRMEPGVQTPDETLLRGRGSCRDSAWLLVQTLRKMGLAARFVSGYLIQLAADEKPLEGPAGPEADFTDLHAWCEVYLPGAGWVGLDATSGLLAGEGHIPLACTAEPSLAAPLTGGVEPVKSTMNHEMKVRRFQEAPTTAKPYSENTWVLMDDVGRRVDADLAKLGVRMTMGGEPTFVYAREPDADEWNVSAMGPTKRGLGSRLLYRLQERFAPGGLLFHGQGKWYPGEELPRWALGVYYRKDGKPVWERSELLAREGDDPRYGVSALTSAKGTIDIDDARELALEIARGLGVADYFVKPARDPIAGENSTGTFPGVPPVRGFVLPLRWWAERDGWVSSRWDELGEPVVLMQGDSPMGYRLPLGNLGTESFPGGPPPMPYSFFEVAPDLPRPGDYRSAPFSRKDFDALRQDGREAYSLITALCVELRDGGVYVFLPPQYTIEVWLRLIASVEAAAAVRGLPVFLEGYPPPSDPRMLALLVTPDPGVIEVNIPPAESWEQLRDLTVTLSEEARKELLISEKFGLDGRPAGSGGGNHITLGGQVPAESPFLNDPGLLRSLITYFQHHPALSYTFSGLFVGPTSQAPRIDEGRHESLYELEIAFQKLPEAQGLPWLSDRLLRHHLTDLTGNTHRAEICIDKLYPPDRV